MSVDDRTRLHLHRKLSDVLGPEEADTLMAHLPPVTWDQVATTADLDAMRVAIVNELRAEITAGDTGIRSDMTTMEAGIRSDMQSMEAGIRTELQVGLAGLRTEFVEASNRQIKWLVGFAAVWSTLLLTVAGFLS